MVRFDSSVKLQDTIDLTESAIRYRECAFLKTWDNLNNKVCKALEAVNLKSSELLDHPSSEICNGVRQNALVEMFQILTTVCESHKLALAQTWVPCKHRRVVADGGGDADTWGFGNAWLEHHLQKGQGVGGRAFSSKSSCFSSDMTHTYTGLSGCDDYILELFTPPCTTALSKHRYFGLRLGDNEGESNITGRTSIAIRSSILQGQQRPFFETNRGGSFLRWGHVYVHGWKPRRLSNQIAPPECSPVETNRQMVRNALGPQVMAYINSFHCNIQEEFISICGAAHIPVIWATQVLESLVKSGLPTRAEITDVANGRREAARAAAIGHSQFAT
ncbi:hypothetical protein IFM89_014475 [Coptis chinensis]|uniref:Pyruvate kinase n=1 Tax=Coptis chinensis TaxID=261450 RepID=A0A835HBL9_9MAGN|nr:hypothetical protein IFM89_014475 [Coptis chinensis]